MDVAFSPDGKILATIGADKRIVLLDVVSGKELHWFMSPRLGYSQASFSFDGKFLAAVTSRHAGEAALIYDVSTGRLHHTLSRKDSPRCVIYSPDGKVLATDTVDNKVRFWDADTYKELATLDGCEESTLAMVFSPDSKLLAVASSQKTVQVWDVQGKKKLRQLESNDLDVRCMRFSPDGRVLACGGESRLVYLWDPFTGKRTGTIKVPTLLWVRSIDYSPDGRLLAIGGGSGVVRLWDLANKRKWADLAGHGDFIRAIRFSPDGKLLASAGDDMSTRLWEIPKE
ncbi:MAG: WD40 repeat domain-containing protein [Gemmataceae bacterium]|nr:WD40 repeat domain-containing protein [Gemmataceae bacterium]